MRGWMTWITAAASRSRVGIECFLLVVSWISMIAALACGVVFLITRSNIAHTWTQISSFTWLGCSIFYSYLKNMRKHASPAPAQE